MMIPGKECHTHHCLAAERHARFACVGGDEVGKLKPITIDCREFLGAHVTSRYAGCDVSRIAMVGY